MNEKAIYELTITEKLEQLSVPDKIDAIWARIETQLDIDMPTDDGPPSQPPPGPSMGFWPGLVLVAAFIAIIYFVNNKTNTAPSDSAIPAEPATISAPGNSNNSPPPARSNVGSLPTATPQNNSSTIPTAERSAGIVDSTVSTIQPEPDTSSTSPVLLAPPVVKPVVDTAGAKKQRGVKGLNDSDYRIVPTKKDGQD